MNPVGVAACPPGDFEDHAGLLISLTDLLAGSPRTIVELVRGTVDRIPLVAIVDGEAERQQAIVLLTDWGLPAHLVHFAAMPVSTWTRDFSPSFVRLTDGRIVLVDAQYTFPDRPNEDLVATALAAHFDLPRYRAPLALDGGNLLSNGRSVCCISSATMEINRVRAHREVSPAEIAGVMKDWYGFDRTILLDPPVGYRTLHVDMFATFTAPDVAVVGQCDSLVDSQSALILDRNAARLAEVPVGRQARMRVHRIPMPPYDGKRCRTYTNVVFANGRLLVPHYSDVDPVIEGRVMNLYAELLPDWELGQINCDEIICGGGALRCATKHIPWLYDRFRHRAPRGASSSWGALTAAEAVAAVADGMNPLLLLAH
jgi:agmatine/peptidylarginine deiminase